MKKLLCHPAALALAVSLFAGIISQASAADYAGYAALDQSQPVSFDGNTVTWNGKTFTLDDHTVFLDYRLKREQLAGNPHAFNNLGDAAKALKSGTAEKPMLLLTAPGVYWVDDPDDPAIRGAGTGAPPLGMTIACDHLNFYGLSTHWQNVVFACNRGQTQGSAGNFTMFRIEGVGLKSENVTFGNYCNVDLKFPLAPSLGRTRRAEAIAQAQLFSYSGNDGVAINSAFVSRLNLLPFARTYLNCHIESSGHAGGQSTYIGSTLEFYGVNFSGGRAYLNCDITFKPGPAALAGRGPHRFGFIDGTGAGGVCVDTRFHRSQELIDRNIAVEVSWDRVPQAPTTRHTRHAPGRRAAGASIGPPVRTPQCCRREPLTGSAGVTLVRRRNGSRARSRRGQIRAAKGSSTVWAVPPPLDRQPIRAGASLTRPWQGALGQPASASCRANRCEGRGLQGLSAPTGWISA